MASFSNRVSTAQSGFNVQSNLNRRTRFRALRLPEGVCLLRNNDPGVLKGETLWKLARENSRRIMHRATVKPRNSTIKIQIKRGDLRNEARRFGGMGHQRINLGLTDQGLQGHIQTNHLRRHARGKHLIRRHRIMVDIGLSRRGDIAGAVHRAAHQNQPPDVFGKCAVQLQRQRKVCERPQRTDHQLAGMGTRALHEKLRR